CAKISGPEIAGPNGISSRDTYLPIPAEIVIEADGLMTRGSVISKSGPTSSGRSSPFRCPGRISTTYTRRKGGSPFALSDGMARWVVACALVVCLTGCADEAEEKHE